MLEQHVALQPRGARECRRSLRFVGVGVETRPVGPEDVADLGALFDRQRSTRHCWCMAFCSTRARFAAGWLGGGNRDRFVAMAEVSQTPMGVLALVAGQPVGWCACGPRSRYMAAIGGRSKLLLGRERAEDERVWLLACFFVGVEHRGQGVTHALMCSAVDLARGEGAVAIEGWPLAASARRSADAFVGQERVYEALGFSCVQRPNPQRAIMRLELNEA